MIMEVPIIYLLQLLTYRPQRDHRPSSHSELQTLPIFFFPPCAMPYALCRFFHLVPYTFHLPPKILYHRPNTEHRTPNAGSFAPQPATRTPPPEPLNLEPLNL